MKQVHLMQHKAYRGFYVAYNTLVLLMSNMSVVKRKIKIRLHKSNELQGDG
jgi:hypothetical protein